MVMPGGPDFSVPLAIASDDLRQLADHDAEHRTFPGGAGPLVALDDAGGTLWEIPALGLPAAPGVAKDARGTPPLLVPEDGAFVRRDPATGTELGRSAVDDLSDGGLAVGVGPVVVYRLPDRVLAYR